MTVQTAAASKIDPSVACADRFVLEQRQQENGLFPGAFLTSNKDMEQYNWVRDNAIILEDEYMASASRKRIEGGLRQIMDNNKWKIAHHAQQKPTEDWMHMHPVYGADLNERWQTWAWVQNDSVGWMQRALSRANDIERARLLTDYYNGIEVWKCPDYGCWEWFPKRLRSSSLGVVKRGLFSFTEAFGEDEKSSEIVKKVDEAMYRILPNETLPDGASPGRDADLAQLFLLWPTQVVDSSTAQEIVRRIRTKLERPSGVIRYEGDTWNGAEHNLGIGKEMAWPIGKLLLYLVTGDNACFEEIRRLTILHGFVPEGMDGGKPNPNIIFPMGLSLYNQASVQYYSAKNTAIGLDNNLRMADTSTIKSSAKGGIYARSRAA